MILIRNIIFYFSFIAIAIGVDEIENEITNKYIKMIGGKIVSLKFFKAPTDSNRFKPSINNYTEIYGNYDFIIVGAGSSGSVIANRLSENQNWTILLLEAGNFGDELTDIPFVGLLNLFSDYNWAYKSIPQKNSCLGWKNHQCDLPRGCAVGGTTIINDLIYSRGNKNDYNILEKQGNPGWSYEDVLPYFKKFEKLNMNDPQEKIDPIYHGDKGELNVEFHQPRSEFVDIFFEANNEIGSKVIDYNGEDQIGCSRPQRNLKDGKRWSNAHAFIKPILGIRKNLHVLSESFVTKILIDNITKIASGVEFVHKSNGFTVRANKEVIISAGAMASPQLLMLSGIGPKDHLRSVNIDVIQDLPVGRQYKTHGVYIGLSFSSNFTVQKKFMRETVEEYLQGEGPLATTYFVEGVGFYQSSFEKIPSYPDIELLLVPPNDFFAKDSIWGTDNSDISSEFYIYPIVLSSRSTGSLELKSNSSFDYPLIDPNLFSDAGNIDMLTLYEGIKIALKLVETEAFKKIGVKLNHNKMEACNNYEYLSEDYWFCAIKQLTMDAYHPFGTCPMGPDTSQGAVVDSQLNVHGIKRLRVADASIFPFAPRGHPSAPCSMVGEKAADMIKIMYTNN